MMICMQKARSSKSFIIQYKENDSKLVSTFHKVYYITIKPILFVGIQIRDDR